MSGGEEIFMPWWWRNLTKGRHTYRWEDNHQICLIEIGWKGMVWIHAAKDTDRWQAVNIMHIWVP
jgi:hypothetical protein